MGTGPKACSRETAKSCTSKPSGQWAVSSRRRGDATPVMKRDARRLERRLFAARVSSGRATARPAPSRCSSLMVIRRRLGCRLCPRPPGKSFKSAGTVHRDVPLAPRLGFPPWNPLSEAPPTQRQPQGGQPIPPCRLLRFARAAQGPWGASRGPRTPARPSGRTPCALKVSNIEVIQGPASNRTRPPPLGAPTAPRVSATHARPLARGLWRGTLSKPRSGWECSRSRRETLTSAGALAPLQAGSVEA